jgi:C4-dicarboxylate-specific signal transduction histidine kinase
MFVILMGLGFDQTVNLLIFFASASILALFAGRGEPLHARIFFAGLIPSAGILCYLALLPRLRLVNSLRASLKAVQEAQIRLLQTSKLASLGEMAGGIAHEINNPLCILANVSTLLRREMDSPAPNRERALKYLSKGDDTIRRIKDLVDGLRTVSRNSEADTMEPVMVSAVVGDTLGICSQKFKSSGVGLTVDYDSQESVISGRTSQVSQVLLNLLNNAFDAVADSHVKAVKISVSTMDRFVEMRVIDSGHGIPEEVQGRIFDPFFTTKPAGKGTGLGLSVSLGIVRNHGGELRLEKRDEGTCFVLRLPRYGHNQASPPAHC